MGDRKRWSVTYTKHVKQKRKVYQDGFLELQSSGPKVMLYDECEKLLESRFVKKDDIIESGETLAFPSHLVDIGDLYGDHKPISSLSFQGKDEKVLEKSESLHHNSNRKTNFGEKKARAINLSPSQKIIREYKKSEENKCCFSPRCSDTTKSSTTEWQVLYTTQIHQKAKKFHDGFLQLAVRGSQGRQVMLYDTTRRLLDRRFLQRDEIVSSGESLVFDAHLVDIGECEGDSKPPKDLSLQRINCKAAGKTERIYNQAKIPTNSNFPAEYKKSETNKYCFSPSCSDTTESKKTEWQVLYTTQITQKAKKFHDGFLQLIFSGSQGRQVMLYDTTRRLLDSRFLKRDEIVSSGESLVLCSHLVDVGEREKDNKPPMDLALRGINCKAVVKTETTYNQANPTNRKYHAGRPQNNISPGKCTDLNDKSSKIDDAKLSWTVPANKARRAAHEILSNLRKSTFRENVVAVKRALVEESNESQSSDVVHTNIKNQLQEQAQGCNGIVLKELNRKTISVHDCTTDNLKSEAVNEVLPIGAEKVGDHDKRGESQARSAGFYLRSGTTNCSTSILNLESTDFIEPRSVSPAVESQELVALVVDIDGQTSIPPNRSNENLEIESPPRLVSHEENTTKIVPSATPGLCTSQQLKLCEDNKGTADRCPKGSSHVGAVASNGCIADDPSDDVQPKQDFNTNEINDFPSFDLGI
ncbi:Uncharacterized protein Adt_12803 [Abeliophyllum distichum]|uniref:5'-3' DNA helicase ZGRF1-like N-terminal domain-containing protein n=1 Tax=Abeliophyllum distichum TaxID=126358 RepID=A0ABD1URW5_9LAMI